MTDQLGPYDSANFSTTRPSDSATPPSSDSWFVDCSSPTAQDGTQLRATGLNRLVANLRGLWRGAGNLISGSPVNSDSYSDSGLLNAVLQLLQRGQTNYAADSGSANALVVNPTPALKEYKDGVTLRVAPAANLTGAATINVSGLGAVTLEWADGSAFVAGDWPAGAVGEIVCKGGTWRLISLVGPTAFQRVMASSSALPIGATLTATAIAWSSSTPSGDTVGATYSSSAGALATAHTTLTSNSTLMPASQIWMVVSSSVAEVENWVSNGTGQYPWLTTTNIVRTA